MGFADLVRAQLRSDAVPTGQGPVLHFVVLGALLFGAYAWVGPGREDRRDDRIVIDQAQLDHLEEMWRAQWRRDPAPDDVAAIIDRHLRQEVFYREALKRNLDHNDQIIKRRLAQKMEAVADDLSTLMQPPTEEQLRAFFGRRKDLFLQPRAFAFRQVLFLPEESEEGSRMKTLLVSLQRGAAVPPDRQNKAALRSDWPLTAAATLDNEFGPGFAEALENLPLGTWSGPVRSGYGWHLVLLHEKREPSLPAFEQVRDEVAAQREYYAALEAQDRLYAELLRSYTVSLTSADIPPEVRSRFPAR
jgi:peptidyl-prolyl cis-trans isomerase C